MPRQSHTVRRFLLMALLGCGCDAQVTSAYRGERLIQIRGNVVSSRAVPAAEAVLLWWTPQGPPAGQQPDGLLSTPASTDGAFPSAFTLAVYRRPPERALFQAGGRGAVTLDVPAFPD